MVECCIKCIAVLRLRRVMTVEKQTTRKNITLTIVIVSIIALIAAALVAASIIVNTPSTEKEDINADMIVTSVIKKMNYTNLTGISSENIGKYYDIPKGSVSDSAMYISSRTENGTELACFEYTDSADMEKLKKMIAEYTSSKLSNYKKVSDKTLSSRTDISGSYIFVVISDNSDAAVEAFREITGKKQSS